jgi:hypothetical protein
MLTEESAASIFATLDWLEPRSRPSCFLGHPAPDPLFLYCVSEPNFHLDDGVLFIL